MSADNAGAAWDPMVLAGHFQSIAEQSQKLMLRFLSTAARRRTSRHGRPVRPRRRLSRPDDQDDERSRRGRRGADRPVQRQHDSVAPRRRTDAQHREPGRAAAEGQAVQPPGVERERDVQLHPRELSRRFEIAARDGARRQGSRPADGAQGRFLHAPVRRRDVALELHRHQSRSAVGDAEHRRGEPAARARARAGRSRSWRRPVADRHDRPERLSARREHRRDAVQGRLPERAPAAPPVRAVDAESAQAAAVHHHAVDQQVLRARPAAEELVHQMGGRPGAHGVRALLGQSGREARADDVRGLHDPRADRRVRRHRGGDRRASASTRSAIASAAPCSTRRSPI